MKINDMELAKTAFDPKRTRILAQVESQAKTVKEIAQGLNEKPSRLYYHINKLLDQGLLEVRETKQVGNLLEKTYQAVEGLGAFDIDEDFGKQNTDFVIQQFLMYVNKSIAALKEDVGKGFNETSFHSQASILQAELTRKDWRELCAEIRRFINEKNEQSQQKDDQDEVIPITFLLMSYLEEDEINEDGETP